MENCRALKMKNAESMINQWKETAFWMYAKSIKQIVNTFQPRAEGETRGEAKGMIEICLDMSFSKEDILKKLQEKLNISLQQAGEYFEMYGKRTV